MTSRLGRFSVLDQIILVGALILLPMVFPSLAAAAADTKPLVLEIKNFPTIPDIDTIHAMTHNEPAESVEPDPLLINAAILEDYLNQRGSPLAPYAQEILQNENWKLVLAISNGESTMCKRQMYNNCWGVGGAWNLRRYSSFAEGFSDVNRFLGAMYVDQGKDTPEKIVKKYVGSYSPNWVRAVSQVLNQLNSLPLVN